MRTHILGIAALAMTSAVTHGNVLAQTLQIGITDLDGTGIDPAMAASGRATTDKTAITALDSIHGNDTGHLATSASDGSGITGTGSGAMITAGDDGPSERLDTVQGAGAMHGLQHDEITQSAAA